MATKQPKELCREAFGGVLPTTLRLLFEKAIDFCQRCHLEWRLEGGADAPYCFWVLPKEGNEWHVSVEHEDLNYAIIQAIAVAWSNLHNTQRRRSKVVNIKDWR